MNLNITNYYYYSDSTITLAWIRAPPTQWKTFVANRVAHIQYLSKTQDWQYISTTENPADLLTRGVLPQDLISNKLWWNGPQSIHVTPLNKDSNIHITKLETLPEYKRTVTVSAAYSNEFLSKLIRKFSSISKLIRVITSNCLVQSILQKL